MFFFKKRVHPVLFSLFSIPHKLDKQVDRTLLTKSSVLEKCQRENDANALESNTQHVNNVSCTFYKTLAGYIRRVNSAGRETLASVTWL